MLEHLEIRNFALIENLCVDFSAGFNVITGETGSGKSIILGALGLLMGEKADTGAVRSGADEIVIDAVVSVPEGHEILPWLSERGVVPEDGVLYIRRTVRANGGRSLIHVQGQLFSRQDLGVLAESLIDMHGQSEHQSLLVSDRQRRILDSYCRNDSLLSDCQEAFRLIGNLTHQKEELERKLEDGRRQQDYLKFALEEIENAHPVMGEDDELKDRIRILGQFESIYENVTLCNEKLRDVRTNIYDAVSSVSRASKVDPELSSFTARLESARIETEDIASGLRDYLASVDYSQDSVNIMQDRLATLQKLKRKYGPSLADVLAFAENSRETLDMAQNSEEYLRRCEEDLRKAVSDYEMIACKLRDCRKNNAKVLEKDIEEVLRTLGMPNAVFRIEITDSKAGPHGSDQISFMISANPGEPVKPIREIASGGELSRVMLALKTVLSKADSIQTQVFDEIDSGIGGAVALSLAKCMSGLSRTKQVIAITHLAGIASVADSQMVVTKTVDGGRTFTHLKQVEGEDRVHEIARMLSGEENDISLSHARELLGRS